MEYDSLEELYNDLEGAFNVKLRLIRNKYPYIKKENIWEYLRTNKWPYDKGLTISEMVNDIMDVDIEKVSSFVIENSKDVVL